MGMTAETGCGIPAGTGVILSRYGAVEDQGQRDNMQQFSPKRSGPDNELMLSPGATAYLQSIVGGFADCVIVADSSGRPLLFNAAAERLLPGIAADAALSGWPERYGLYLPDRRTLFPADRLPFTRVLRGEKAEGVEIFLQNQAAPEGVWLSGSATPLRDDAGSLRGGMIVFRDITESKQAEEGLRKERERAAAVMDAVGTLVIVFDRHGLVVSFNHACELTTGYTAGEVQGRAFWEVLLLPEEAEQVRRSFDGLGGGAAQVQHENYWLTKDGRRRLIAWSCTAEAGSEYVIGTGVDITERKQTEDELRQAIGMLRAVIDTSPLAIVTMDLEGVVKSWNRAAERIFGWHAEEVLGKPFPIVPAEDEEFFRDNLDRLRRSETIAGVERQRRRRDGAVIDVSLWNAPLKDGAGNVIGAISVIADMTDRKRLEDQFRQSQKMEAVGRLAGGVAHDFNNLLTVISGYTQMLLDGLEEDHPMRSYVEEIVRAGDSAAALTGQLLAFSRRQIVTPQVLDLNALVSGMDNMLHRLIGEDINLAATLAPDLPSVKVDAGQFQQVLMNLAVNARDAMPAGGRITIRTAAEVVDESNPDIPPGSYVVLSVSDTGKGMTEETRRRIFEPFFTTKGRGKGTGLGLSTVFGIVKQAGGEISVESQPGRGSTFRIYLPAIDRAVAAGVESELAPELKKGTETVLVVEDEAGLRKLVREVLQSHGYTVLVAEDFRAALDLSRTHAGPIHLCLTDMIMPGMGGRDLAARLTELRPRLKVLYMSGYTNNVLQQDGTNVAGRFLQKPFTPESLLAKVRAVLDD
jgi:PAS domain S-box-containing protein